MIKQRSFINKNYETYLAERDFLVLSVGPPLPESIFSSHKIFALEKISLHHLCMHPITKYKCIFNIVPWHYFHLFSLKCLNSKLHAFDCWHWHFKTTIFQLVFWILHWHIVGNLIVLVGIMNVNCVCWHIDVWSPFHTGGDFKVYNIDVWWFCSRIFQIGLVHVLWLGEP